MSSEPPVPSKAELTYQRMISSIPSRHRLHRSTVAAPIVDEETYVYEHARSRMSEAARRALDKTAVVPSDVPEELQMRWCICESPEGEFARVRIFKEVDGLIHYLGRLEGQETSVWPFYGVAMRITKPLASFQDRRLLFMPGEDEAIILPQSPAEPIRRVPMSLLEDLTEEDFQKNGWMGLTELAEGSSEEFSQGDAEIRQQRAAPEDEAKDDDEEGDDEAEDKVPRS